MGEEILGTSEEATEEVEHTLLTEPEEGEKKADTPEEKPEEKPEDADTKADDKTKDSEADAVKDGAPETYEDFNVPEGFEVNPEALTEFTGMLKEANVSQENAQKFVDLQVKVLKENTEAQAKAWADTKSKWKDEAANDEEYGKGKYDESMLAARKAVREIGGTELSKALDETGMGSHPEFIRFFVRVGKAIGEDSLTFGKLADGNVPKTHAERLFPHQGKT